MQVLRGTLDKELPAIIASKRLNSLRNKMGFQETFIQYCLRRIVLNAVDGPP